VRRHRSDSELPRELPVTPTTLVDMHGPETTPWMGYLPGRPWAKSFPKVGKHTTRLPFDLPSWSRAP